MGYRLHQGRPVEDEVRRIADRQLEMAIAGLDTCGDPAPDDGLHASRRHIKKIRALIRLVRPALGRRYRDVNGRLRAINRLLAPEADAQAAVATLERLVEQYPNDLPRAVVDNLRAHLVQHMGRAGAQVRSNHSLDAAAALLRAERESLNRWTLHEHGFQAIAGGLVITASSSRRAMKRAVRRASHRRYHAWRQRVKDQWFQVRLLQARCNDALALDEKRLEALDGYLGEHHNCWILRDVLSSDSTLRPADADSCLELIGRYEHTLRTRAETLGAQVVRETPRQFVKRVRRLWKAAQRPRDGERRGASWQPAA